MPHFRLAVLFGLAVLFAVPIADASADGTDLRNERYCEVIPSVTEGDTVTTYVYNTQGLNLCPAEQWDALTEDEVNAEYGSQSAKLNGPRYWTFDELEATGSSTTGEKFTFGGIEASLRATIVTAVGEPTVGDQFYVPNMVQRQTVYTFERGKLVYQLIDPAGNVYVMQAYAQIYDKTLTIKQLANLGQRKILRLPRGWRYRSKRLRYTITLTAAGLAYLVNDNLANSYQRVNKPSVYQYGVPGGCVSKPFDVSINVQGDTAATSVRVGDKTIKRATSNRFTATIPAQPTARSTQQRITVVSRNDAGTDRISSRFRVCAM